MLRWICSYCGEEADYHICFGGVHTFFCSNHWDMKQGLGFEHPLCGKIQYGDVC